MEPSHGVVVAKTHPGPGLTCLAVLDRSKGCLWRPVPASMQPPFWNSQAAASLALGSTVCYTPTGAAATSRHPHRREDLPCTDVAADGPLLKADELYAALAPLSQPSLLNVWPTHVWSSSRHVRPDERVPSFVVITGSIIQIYQIDAEVGSKLRADLDLGGLTVSGVPVTSAALRGSPLAQKDAVNNFGLLILGVARPRDPHSATRSDHEQCAVLLIGWLPQPKASQAWCEPRPVLREIFLLGDRPTAPTDEVCDGPLLSFLELASAKARPTAWSTSEEDLEAIARAKDVLSGAASGIAVARFPQNGCLAIAVPAGGCHQPGQLTVHVIEPAAQRGWKRCPGSESELAGGTIDAEAWPSFLSQVEQWRASGDTTPQAILEALRKCTCCSPASSAPSTLLAAASPTPAAQLGVFLPEAPGPCGSSKYRGCLPGSRDRPWHRSSQWACTKALLHFALTKLCRHSQPGVLYKQVAARLCLWLLERQMVLVTPETASADRVSVVMEMLAKVSRKVDKLAEIGLDLQDFETRCAVARASLDRVVLARARLHALQFALPSLEELVVDDTSIWFDCSLSEDTMPHNKGDVMGRAVRNLGGFPLLDESCRLDQVVAWARSAPVKSTLEKLVVVASVEHLLFGFACDMDSFAQWDVPHLESLLEIYRQVSHQVWVQTERRVEQQSKVVLVVWIAYCLIYKTTQSEHPILSQYGVGLNPDDLRFLVLPNRRAVDAMRAVHTFLRQHHKPQKEVFTLRNAHPTLQLAAQFSRESAALREVLRAEKADARARMDGHWLEVQRQQAEARALRQQISRLEAEEASLSSELCLVQGHEEALQSYLQSQQRSRQALQRARLNWALYPGQPYISDLEEDIRRCERMAASGRAELDKHRASSSLRSELNSVRSALQQRWRDLKAAERPPTAVIQPLPREETAAEAVLFFLYMPSAFRSLSRMTFLAQQMLLPWPWNMQGRWDVDDLSSVQDFKTSWLQHYNAYQSFNRVYHTPPQSRQGSEGAVILLSRGEEPRERDIAGGHIDNLQSREDGVWFPDLLSPCMAWKSDGFTVGSGSLRNPFVDVPSAWRTDYFTERLPEKAGNLQWAMPLGDSISPSRGNMALAWQHDKPGWLAKDQYLTFGTMRAFPYQQLRSLLIMLKGRSLPLAEPAVQCLLRQCMHHVGPLGEDGAPQWKADMFKGSSFLPELTATLADLADDLAQTPRDYAAVPLVAEVTAHASHWHAAAAESSRKLALATSKWAVEQTHQITSASGLAAEHEGAQQAKACIFNLLAMLCTPAGTLTAADAKVLACAVTRARNGLVFGAEQHDKDIPRLMHFCEALMAERVSDLVCAARADSSICSDAVRAVLESAPEDLSWTRCTCSAACFHSWASDGHLYSVNLLNGIVLLDGHRPRRLPSSVTQHPLYLRSFGAASFEISTTSSGAFQTAKAIDGCFYEFQERGTDDLAIVEVSPCGQRLRLIPHAQLEDAVPVRLVELHSHWLVEDSGVVLFRPVEFRSRDVSFAVWLDDTACLRVPDHLMRSETSALLESEELEERLVILESPVVDVLSKFEDPAYIHAYVRGWDNGGSQELWKLELPRFKMSFEKRGPTLVSCDYRGYRLADCQQLHDTLTDFDAYLVLQSMDRMDATVADVKVLVPVGTVQAGQPVKVVGEGGASAERHALCYDVHDRFGHLQAPDVHSRLMLATLYAATGSLLPDRRLGATGAEVAMQLVRQSWGNAPLTDAESRQLANLLDFTGRAPGLELLCRELDHSSRQLAFLHGGRTPSPLPPWQHQDLVIAAYLNEARRTGCGKGSFRRLLTPEEEHRALGISSGGHSRPVPEVFTTDVRPAPFDDTVVSGAEAALKDYVAPRRCAAHSTGVHQHTETFPLENANRCMTTMGREMFRELRESWEAHHCDEADEMQVTEEGLVAAVWEQKLELVALQRREMDDYLAHALSLFPSEGAGKRRAAALRIRQCANTAPKAGALDILCMSWRPALVCVFNPFLSADACRRVHDAVLVFLGLCVLEDKFRRLWMRAAGSSTQLLLQELRVTRVWDVRKYPRWLAFEVEGRLQIRPVQYAVAMKLIEDPGAVVQLNMGEGKTRVIVPMLVLYWADGHRLLRVTALSALLGEMFEFMHRNLCASFLGCRVFKLPFHRDVELRLQDVRAMESAIGFCRSCGGVLLTAVEHRLSLQLKWHELWMKGEADLCAALSELAALPTRELLDESDEVLRHKYQLIYAVGSHIPLPDGAARWLTAEALLRSLRRSTSVLQLLDSKVAERMPSPRNPEAFSRLRLIAGPKLEEVCNRLYQRLAEDLLGSPPYEFAWLAQYRGNWNIIHFLTNPEATEACLPTELEPERQSVLLAVRGFLACGVLRHCLEKRHRVDYGVRRSKAGKRLAVPFRASDTPSERSEFGHPDCAIALTLLSYYYDGLSALELKMAFRKLLECGPSAQHDQYNAWFELSREGMSEDVQTALDNVEKIDLSNAVQFDMLYTHYRLNFETVGFWLKHCVLPGETSQFPHKLVANAWHLVDNPDGLVHGFSGTNDNHRALPLQVSQKDLPALKGTNGKMLDLILSNPDFSVLPGEGAVHWRTTLDFVAQRHVDVLIDCGALTAGASNLEVASHMLGFASRGFQGVVYFDTELGQWMVLDLHGRRLPKQTSPIREADCFAFFDEARSRGADLKLKPQAVALVTIGPKCCKDKLMQAAGRMRLLGRGQKLQFLASREVGAKIEALASSTDGQRIRAVARAGVRRKPLLTSKDMLEWVMLNTVKAAEDALPEWARQGAVFATTKEAPDRFVLDEVLELRAFYRDARAPQQVSSIVRREMAAFRSRVRGDLPDSVRGLDVRILERAERYGSEIHVVSSVFDEEYERELEKEREVEKEVEIQVGRFRPAAESDWNYEAAWDAKSTKELPISVISLAEATKQTHRLKAPACFWPDAVVCTQNFAHTVQAKSHLDDFLRPVNAALVFRASGEWLLVSEREADALLGSFWKREAARASRPSLSLLGRLHGSGSPATGEAGVVFVNFPLALAATVSGSPPSCTLPEPRQGCPALAAVTDDRLLAVLQAFAGQTGYPTEGQRRELLQLLRKQGGRQLVRQMVSARGMEGKWERSRLAWIMNSL